MKENKNYKEEQENNKILLEEWSPLCNIQAFVEETDTTYYFYLWMHPNTEYMQMRTCWIANKGKAPKEHDMESLNKGIAPRMQAQYVKHDLNGITLEPDQFRIVWFEEGDAAALLYQEEIIAVIPGWSDERFHGYAKYANGTGTYAWELEPAREVISARVQKCEAYWKNFDEAFFQKDQESQMAAIESFFGKHQHYFAIDGGHFPPKALVTGTKDGRLYAFTLGVSLLAQPLVEQYYQEDVEQYRRFELGIELEPGMSNEDTKRILNYMAAQTNLPWREIGYLAEGHTIPCDAVDGYAAIRLVKKEYGPKFEEVLGDPVNVLWVELLTNQQYEDAMKE